MFEALIILVMLLVVLLILIHAARLTGRKPKPRPLIGLFEFKCSLDRPAQNGVTSKTPDKPNRR